MKKIITPLAAFAVTTFAFATFTGCRNDAVPEMSWHNLTLLRNDIHNRINMEYPYAEGGAVADSINLTIRELLKFGLYVMPEQNPYTLEQAVDTMIAQKLGDGDGQIPYEFSSTGSIYLGEDISSIDIETYAYTGGAHGITTGYLVNFDNKTGRRLALTDIVSDTVRLSEINRAAFLSHLASKESQEPDDLKSYLFVEPDKLSLPENVGFNEDGAVMLYNQYDIAAYVFGASRYVIPYADIEPLLKVKVKPVI